MITKTGCLKRQSVLTIAEVERSKVTGADRFGVWFADDCLLLTSSHGLLLWVHEEREREREISLLFLLL